jgi:putative hemolysin
MRAVKDHKILIKKMNNQTVYNSTTLVDDGELYYVFPQTGLYEVVLRCRCQGSNAADIKAAWTVEAGVANTTSRYCFGIGTNNGANVGMVDTMVMRETSSLSATIAYSPGDGTNSSWFEEKFIVEVTTPNVKLQLQWAQSTAEASSTMVRSNSHLTIEKLFK